MQPLIDFATRYPITALVAWALFLSAVVKILRLPFAHFQLLHTRRTNRAQAALRASGHVVDTGLGGTPAGVQRVGSWVERMKPTFVFDGSTPFCLRCGGSDDSHTATGCPFKTMDGYKPNCGAPGERFVKGTFGLCRYCNRPEKVHKELNGPVKPWPWHDARCGDVSCWETCPVLARLRADGITTHPSHGPKEEIRECCLSHGAKGLHANHWCALKEGHNAGEAEIWHQDRDGARWMTSVKPMLCSKSGKPLPPEPDAACFCDMMDKCRNCQDREIRARGFYQYP